MQINTSVRLTCNSGHRCDAPSCVNCSRRYAGRLAGRILSGVSGVLYSVEITPNLSGLPAFWKWCVAVRNLIDYQRRQNILWLRCGIYVWFSRDNRVRGIATLDPAGPTEFMRTLNARWPFSVREIGSDNLRNAIYESIRPGVVSDVRPQNGRYQTLKLAIWPRRRIDPLSPRPSRHREIEPMPIIF